MDLGDHFAFVIERTARPNIAIERTALRYRLRSALAGRRFEEATIDIAFGDQGGIIPDRLLGSGHLVFAGFDPITVPVLPLDRHIAEKLHAYTRLYGGQRVNTRVKDLVDLVLIRSVTDLTAGRLRQAIAATFAPRGSHTIPLALHLPPATWGPTYRQLAAEVGLDPTISTGHHLAASFLDPVLDGTVADDARWNPSRGSW